MLQTLRPECLSFFDRWRMPVLLVFARIGLLATAIVLGAEKVFLNRYLLSESELKLIVLFCSADSMRS